MLPIANNLKNGTKWAAAERRRRQRLEMGSTRCFRYRPGKDVEESLSENHLYHLETKLNKETFFPAAARRSDVKEFLMGSMQKLHHW